MKRLLITISTVFVLIFNTNAQSEKSLLWEISGNGLKQSSYIYGTIHIICPDDYFMTNKTKEVFNKSEQVFLELDMDDPNMMKEMQNQMIITNGKTLQDYCSEEGFKTLDAYFTKNMGIGMSVLKVMKPIALMSMSYMAILDCEPKSYETEFVTMATSQKKEVLGFETVKEQMDAFDNIPYKTQMKLLADMVENEEKGKKEFTEMVAEYKEQDLDGLQKLMDDSEWNMKEFEDFMINNRNANWIPIIEKQAKEKSTFIAVGAGHLGGEKGVLELLKKKGYTVKVLR